MSGKAIQREQDVNMMGEDATSQLSLKLSDFDLSSTSDLRTITNK